MANYTTNDLRNGMKIMLDGAPHTILDCEFVKPGKGQAFARIKLRNLKTGRVNEKTFKSGESMEKADVVEKEMQYLYNDGEVWHFMMQETYEQYEVTKDIVNDAVQWLKEENICTIVLWNDTPLQVEPPNFVELRIVDTDPGLKGDTSGGGGKPATLETGAVVRVPLFVQIDEVIKIDTRNGEYISRVKASA